LKIESKFKDGKVSSTVSGLVNMTKEDNVSAGTFFLDNDMIAGAMLLCTQLKFEVGKKVETECYFPSALQTLKLTFDVKSLKKIKVGGKDVECYETELSVANVKATFWVTKDGRMVKNEQGPITTEIGSLD
jgi:hypothetical protein